MLFYLSFSDTLVYLLTFNDKKDAAFENFTDKILSFLFCKIYIDCKFEVLLHDESNVKLNWSIAQYEKEIMRNSKLTSPGYQLV